jgi:hypothetical protein
VPEDRGPLPTEFELETRALALRGMGEGASLGMKYVAKVALNFLIVLIVGECIVMAISFLGSTPPRYSGSSPASAAGPGQTIR